MNINITYTITIIGTILLLPTAYAQDSSILETVAKTKIPLDNPSITKSEANGVVQKNSAVYAKVGLLGGGLGYTYRFTDYFGFRLDFSTMGTYKRTQKFDEFTVRAAINSDKLTPYIDLYPFRGAFHITAGVGFGNQKISGIATVTDGQVTINKVSVNVRDDEYVKAEVKWPSVAPYLGIGWKTGTYKTKGFIFSFDAGAYYGKGTSDLSLSPAVRARLQQNALALQSTADYEISQQEKEVQRKIDPFKFTPQMYFGVGYRFQ